MNLLFDVKKRAGIMIYSIGTLASAFFLSINNPAQGANLVINSDFSAGNNKFWSDYKYVLDDLHPEGTYTIGTDPSSFHNEWSSFGDRTTGTGNMMIVNGDPEPNKTIWAQTITVTPNTNYNFSAWIASVFDTSPAELKFAINSVLISPLFIAPETPGEWKQLNAIWNSGSATTAEISIKNQNTVRRGNDLAIDDILFEPISVPEPSLILGLLSVVACSVRFKHKYKQQQEIGKEA